MVGTRQHRCSTRLPFALLTVGIILSGTLQAATPLQVGFLASETSPESMGPHDRAAWEAATTTGDASLLLLQPNGDFVDRAGQKRALSDFDVVWYHQGDAIERNAMYRSSGLSRIRRFAENGGGVLLSGGALAMVAQLRLETEIRPQRHDMDNYRDPAGMIPVESAHPAFAGLTHQEALVWLSRGGCRAVADFYWGGPAEGMVLARTPNGPENPLVEYTLGEGRVIVFGGHWPDYADAANPHRANLLRLTSNLLGYLANRPTWHDVVIRSDYPPSLHPTGPGFLRSGGEPCGWLSWISRPAFRRSTQVTAT